MFGSIVIVSKIQGFVCVVLNCPEIKLKVMPDTQRNARSSPLAPCMCNPNCPRRATVLLLTLVDIEMYPLEADTVRLSAVVCLCCVVLCVLCCMCVLEKEKQHHHQTLNAKQRFAHLHVR